MHKVSYSRSALVIMTLTCISLLGLSKASAQQNLGLQLTLSQASGDPRSELPSDWRTIAPIWVKLSLANVSGHDMDVEYTPLSAALRFAVTETATHRRSAFESSARIGNSVQSTTYFPAGMRQTAYVPLAFTPPEQPGTYYVQAKLYVRILDLKRRAATPLFVESNRIIVNLPN